MSSSSYHHRDLRAECVRAAMELLEEGDAPTGLSLRAVTRRAGVSPGAPYRHFADRDALISAVAAVGYRELAGRMVGAQPSPSTVEDLAAVGVAYVEFALRRRALFQLMFGEPCDRENGERVAATAAIMEFVSGGVRRTFPNVDVEATTTAIWALVHGLAFLHLDGKLDSSDPGAVSERVRAAVRAVLTVRDHADPATPPEPSKRARRPKTTPKAPRQKRQADARNIANLG
jgi:AcrR family transcriptional regulator